VNRFPALLMVFDLLAERPEVQVAGVDLPDTSSLKGYVESGLPLSNATLKQEADRSGDPGLKSLLEWSNAVNDNVARTVKNVPPFKGVRECLEKMNPQADLIVVSQTPEEALVREWREHGIDGYVEVIAGQELGTKGEHLAMATKGRFEADRILMIGDAPGDRKAAAAVGACFFPVNPGQEETSWQRLIEEGFDRFLAGTYRGDYEAQLTAEFEALLPETPPWKK
jgi:phosphoglycolate phosphatase-like HAD superfamily hydrolase